MGNRLMAGALTQRRNHGPYLENLHFSACHAVFRARRTVFLRHATYQRLDEQNAVLRANSTLGRFLTTLSFARAFRRARNHLGASKASGGLPGGNGPLFRGAITFVTAEVLKLSCVERLFQLNRKKLLSIPAFATGYKYWRRMMDALESL